MNLSGQSIAKIEIQMVDNNAPQWYQFQDADGDNFECTLR